MIMARSFIITSTLVLLSSVWSVESLAHLEGMTHELETLYIEDCRKDVTPHGFYGAFLEPCEFSFFQGRGDNVCDTGSLLEAPRPVHWLFKLQDHIDNNDWENMSSDDVPDFDELLLWPDQCVGVHPRCYTLGENDLLDKTLAKLFPEGTPVDATHVRVDCRVDAMELSRVVYSFASGLEKSLPVLIAWMVTIVLFTVVAMSYCLYGCCRLCNTPLTKQYHSYQAVPATFVREEYDCHDPEKSVHIKVAE